MAEAGVWGVDKCGVMHRVIHSLCTCFLGLYTVDGGGSSGRMPAERGRKGEGKKDNFGRARLTMLGGKVDYIRGQERQCWGVRLTICDEVGVGLYI